MQSKEAPKMTRKELEESFAKKYQEQMDALERKEAFRQKELSKSNDMCKLPKLTKSSEEAMVQRVYADSKSYKEKSLLALTEKRNKAEAIPTRKLSEGDMEDFVQRMYYKEKEKKERTVASLQQKYQPPPSSKRLSSATQSEMASRLSKSNREEIVKALFEKHVAPLDPKRVVISPEEVDEMAKRLYTPK